jgi:hypothetical protein
MTMLGGGTMNGADDTQEEKLLLAELKAIEHWDRDYHMKSRHDPFEQEAYGHRQDRRREITESTSTSRLLKNSFRSLSDHNML